MAPTLSERTPLFGELGRSSIGNYPSSTCYCIIHTGGWCQQGLFPSCSRRNPHHPAQCLAHDRIQLLVELNDEFWGGGLHEEPMPSLCL